MKAYIGFGAAKRAATEWFEGHSRIREIVENDWLYWGDVRLGVDGAKITVNGDVAWLSTTGTVIQTQAFDTAIEFHLNDLSVPLDRLAGSQRLSFNALSWRDGGEFLQPTVSCLITSGMMLKGLCWLAAASIWARCASDSLPH